MLNALTKRWRRHKRFVYGCVILMCLFLGGLYLLMRPSPLQRAVERAGGTYECQSSVRRSAMQVLSDLYYRNPPFKWVMIRFVDQKVDDEWLQEHRSELGEIASLHLTIHNTQISDVGLQEVLGNVWGLDLRGEAITDKSLETIATLPNLADLGIAHTSITGNGCSQLINSRTQLSGLSMDGQQAVNGGLTAAAQLPLLQGLTIYDADDATVALLATQTMRRLNNVYLDSKHVTDQCLADLETLTQLEHLYLLDTSISAEGVEKLKANLPDCVITYMTQAQVDANIRTYEQSLKSSSWLPF